jgi:murein DD-endopeptidase MepM/ murein hydrolase activator NlpD
MRTVIFLVFVLVLAVVLLFAFSATPAVSLSTEVKAIGHSTAIEVRIEDPHGVRSVAAAIEQNGNRYDVWSTRQPTRRIFWQRNVNPTSWNFVAGTRSTPQLKDGKAELIISATSNDFAARSSRLEREVTVATQAPSVSVDSDQHYLYVGMADLVTFNISGYWTDAGVRVGDETFRGWPMPGGKPGLFSIFAFGWNMPAGTMPVVYANNPAGNEATGQMAVEFPKREQPKYRVRDLQIDDKFMQKVVNELDPNGAGDLVARFVKINNQMRRDNNRTLSDLRLKTEPRFLWSQPFMQQSNSKVESNFADVRNYIYKGEKIDQQVHLGYDLSVTQHVGVQASNDGRVIYAAPLGIYGNCIVLDHGYGLQTIYGHLSEIAVHEGDNVKRGQVMGKSGMTGMAGGDHIHFSMQLEGVQIDPREWWDAHWIKDHIANRVELPGFNQ